MRKIIEFLAFNLPLVKNLVLFVVAAGVGAFLIRVQIANRRWLMIVTRLIGAALVVPLILSFIVPFLDKARPQIYVSPDSQHIAEYSYEAGFLGRDLSGVVVGKRWSTQFETVYEYHGPSDWKGTDVRWLSNDRLLIRYYPDPTRFQQCKTQAEGISVQCEDKRGLEWPAK